MKDQFRMPQHQRNADLEASLTQLNDILIKAKSLTKKPIINRYPIIFVMGCARSGTTLFTQWLASLGYFGYVSNLISRFYSYPAFGARIQKIMVELDDTYEITSADQRRINFTSQLGKSKGIIQPHEFWYFWRRFYRFGQIQVLPKEELERVKSKQLVSEIAELEQVLEKPLALKGMILNWHIPHLYQLFENPLIIFIRRDTIANAQSLLKARQDFYGSIEQWYSFKPPEYVTLQREIPEKQVLGQVFHTNEAIDSGLELVDSKHKLEVSYEKFCDNPTQVFHLLQKKLLNLGFKLNDNYIGEERFNRNPIRYSDNEYQTLKRLSKGYSRK